MCMVIVAYITLTDPFSPPSTQKLNDSGCFFLLTEKSRKPVHIPSIIS